jgi:putative phage-type endonuclease
MTGRRVTPEGILVARAGMPEHEFLALRQTGLGGSDIAALLGMDKYSSPWKLYLEKRGEIPHDLPREPFLERAAYWGHKHETDIADAFSEIHGLRTRRIGTIRNMHRPWMIANLDRQVIGCPDGPCPLECKNRSLRKAGEWGESGDPDGVPDREALQSLWYLAVTGYRHVHVAVLINGNDDRYYRLERDEKLLGDLVAMAGGFWQRVQKGDPPPIDGSEAVTELLRDLWDGAEGAVRIVSPAEAGPLFAARRQLKEQIDELETEVAEVENRLREALGDSEIALAPDGGQLYTWKRNGQFSAKRFKQAYPELAEKYVRLVPETDKEALAAEHPDIYRACRARVLRTPRGEAA